MFVAFWLDCKFPMYLNSSAYAKTRRVVSLLKAEYSACRWSSGQCHPALPTPPCGYHAAATRPVFGFFWSLISFTPGLLGGPYDLPESRFSISPCFEPVVSFQGVLKPHCFFMRVLFVSPRIALFVLLGLASLFRMLFVSPFFRVFGPNAVS